MKTLMFALLVLLAPTLSLAAGGGFGGEKFTKVVYYQGATAQGSGSGASYNDAKAIVDGDAWAIPAGTVIEKVYVVVDTIITGTSNLDVGDDDDADGYVDGSLSVTLGTVGMYGWDAKLAGAYMRVQTAGATDAADIDVVPAAKAYLAAGKEVKLDVTGTNTAGKFKVVIQGMKF